MTGTPLEIIKWLYGFDKEKVFDIQEHKEKKKRSLNANA